MLPACRYKIGLCFKIIVILRTILALFHFTVQIKIGAQFRFGRKLTSTSFISLLFLGMQRQAL